MTDLHTKIAAIRDDLNAHLLERETAVEAALLSLLTANHLLLLGPPGTAKSMLVRSVCERVTGTTYFERLLTRFSTPEELFGPLSLAALEHDRYQRVTTGTVVQAHIAFVDEVFKANSAILNSLLGLMNERIYHENGCATGTPLLSLFGASNETPEDASLAALYDRFLLRVTVPYLTDDDSLRRLFSLVPQLPTATLTLDELKAAQDEIGQLPLSDDARDAIIAIKHSLEQEGVAASDRRWQACARLVKARAWLEGDPDTAADHCDILVHALWTEPAAIRTVERVVSKIANPLALEAVELEDAAADLYQQRPPIDHPQLTQALEPLLRQLGDIHTRIEQRIAAAPTRRTHRARQALAKIATWHRALSQLALQSLSRLHMAPGAGA